MVFWMRYESPYDTDLFQSPNPMSSIQEDHGRMDVDNVESSHEGDRELLFSYMVSFVIEVNTGPDPMPSIQEDHGRMNVDNIESDHESDREFHGFSRH